MNKYNRFVNGRRLESIMYIFSTKRNIGNVRKSQDCMRRHRKNFKPEIELSKIYRNIAKKLETGNSIFVIISLIRWKI